MGLSLRNLTHKIGNVFGGVERQLNPFDNGATYNNPQPLRVQGPVFGGPSPIQFGRPMNQRLVGPPPQQPQQVLRVGVAPPQNLRIGNQVIGPSPIARTGVLPPTQPDFIHRTINNIVQQPVGLYQGVERGPLASAIKLGTAKLTNNQRAAQNAMAQLKANLPQGSEKPILIRKNGKLVENPARPGVVKNVFNLALGAGEGKPMEPGAVGKFPKDKLTPEGNIPFSKADQAKMTAELKAGAGHPKSPVSLKTSLISGRDVNPEALAELPPAEQMKRAYGEKVFHGPPLVIKSQRPNTQIELTAQTPKAAIGETTYHMAERSKQFNNGINLGSKLSEGDKAKLSDALNGVATSKPENPELFNQTKNALSSAYDRSLALDRLGGGKTARFNKGNFSPLYFRADTARLNELGIPKDQQYPVGDGTSIYVQAGEDSALTAGKYKGYHNIQRKYASYSDAAQKTNGILQPLNKNALEDARMYANGGHSVIEGNLLYKQLKRIAPDEVSQDLNTKMAGNGEPLVHAANGQLPFNVTKRLNKQLVGYKSNRIDNPLGEAAFKTIEVPAKGLRKVAFIGAPIHYANLTRSFLATTIPSGHGVTAVRGIGEALTGSLHPKLYAKLEKAATESGVRDFAGQLGVVDRDTQPNLLGKGTGAKGKVEKYSPFALQMRNMNRFNNVLGWKLAERVKELGIDPQTANARGIGTEINKVIDRINPKMEGLNPIGERLATSGSIAPHWIRANIGLVKDALVKSVPGFAEGKTGFGLSSGGDIARTNVFGGRMLVGATAILASALATGQMPNLQKALSEAGLNLNNPYPNIEGKSKTKPKYPGGPRYGQVTNLPSDPIGLAVGLLTDPKHFAIARETPALSALTQAVTNQDFFGNPVVPDTGQSKAKKTEQMAIATAEKLLPFTAQGAINKALTTGQKVEAALGMRTKTNPNDKNYQQVQNYFKVLADVKKGLDTNAARAVDEYSSGGKDPKTGAYAKPSVWDTQAKATELLKNPSAINALVAMNKKIASEGGKVDPLWKEDPAKIRAYLVYQADPNPFSEERTKWYADNSKWYQPLADARSKFFNSLPKGDPNKPAAPVEYPSPSQAVQNEKNQYYKLTDSKQKYQFISSHPELQAQFDKEFQYKNDLLTMRGYTPYKAYPVAQPGLEKFITQYNSASKSTRKSIRNSNPKAYQDMIAYYDSVDLYNIGKQAAVSQLQGEPDYTSKEAKAMKSVANDIYQNADGTYSIVPAGWMQGLGGSSGSGKYSKRYRRSSRGYSSGSGRKYVSRSKAKLLSPDVFSVDIDAGKGPRVAKLKMGSQPKGQVKLAKLSSKSSIAVKGKPKVSSKKSMV